MRRQQHDKRLANSLQDWRTSSPPHPEQREHRVFLPICGGITEKSTGVNAHTDVEWTDTHIHTKRYDLAPNLPGLMVRRPCQ
jgi:hypothetical protein